MNSTPTIACFGAAHWDYIGQSGSGFSGADRPGIVRLRAGGVAANAAIALAQMGLTVELVSVVGHDREGNDLVAALKSARVGTDLMHRSLSDATGRYIAIEDETGELIAAVADCEAIEHLRPTDIELGPVRAAAYWLLETNLPVPVIDTIAASEGRPPLVANPVSPARAERLSGVLNSIAILYCNRREVEALCKTSFATSEEAASALIRAGAARAVVTDGPGSVCDASAASIVSVQPDVSNFASATGAGDAFLARHLAAVVAGYDTKMALRAATARPGQQSERTSIVTAGEK